MEIEELSMSSWLLNENLIQSLKNSKVENSIKEISRVGRRVKKIPDKDILLWLSWITCETTWKPHFPFESGHIAIISYCSLSWRALKV